MSSPRPPTPPRQAQMAPRWIGQWRRRPQNRPVAAEVGVRARAVFRVKARHPR